MTADRRLGDGRLADLAESIADGVEIDWASERAQCSDAQRETLERLEWLDRMRRTLDADDPADEPLDRLTHWGPLRILGRLGRGASSIVFRAHDPGLDREVALKLRTGGPSRPADDAAWIEEARRLASVRHPNVVAVHGAAVHEGIPGLWCDRVCGTTLGERNPASAPGAAEALDAAEALLSAILAVHRAGLVHGDIKPDNVMCEADGRLLLMDFGAAGRFDALQAEEDRAGTPLAMAPERFSGARLAPSADLFGAGVVLFHWLEGRYPVVGTSAHAIREQWARGVRPSFRKKAGPRALRRLIERMMAVDPADRPSAEEAVRRVRRMRSAPLRRLRMGTALAVIGGLSLALLIALSALHSADRAQRETAAVNDLLSDVLEAPRRTRLGPNLSLADLLSEASDRAELRLADQPAARARVYGTIGTSFVKLQRFERAGRLLEEAERLNEQQGRSVDAAEVRLARAELATNQNRFDDARALYQDILERIDAGSAESAALRVRARIGLAQCELAAGRLESARAAIDAAFAEWGTGALLREPDTLRASILLVNGEWALRTGRYDEARTSLEQALAFYVEWGGVRHPNSAVARTGLIEALDRLGRLDDAVVLAEENVAINVDWLGPTDRFSIAAWDALANIHSRRGDLDRALRVNRDALDALAQSPPDDPFLVLQLEANRIAYLLDVGERERALELAESVLPRLVRTLGAGHTLTWMTALNKADALLELNRPIESLALARDLDRQIRNGYGDEHLFARVAGYLVGGSLSAMGDFEAAEPLLIDHHAALSAQLGPDHSVSLKAAFLLARHWQRRGRSEDAAALAEPALRQARESLGPQHQRTRELAELLVGLRAVDGEQE